MWISKEANPKCLNVISIKFCKKKGRRVLLHGVYIIASSDSLTDPLGHYRQGWSEDSIVWFALIMKAVLTKKEGRYD